MDTNHVGCTTGASPPKRRARKLSDYQPYPHASIPGAWVIPLPNGNTTIVDEQHAYLGNTILWTLTATGYVTTGVRYSNGSTSSMTLHRVIARLVHGSIPEGLEVDHRNRCRTDNRASNLRLVSHTSNIRNRARFKSNSSGYIGVYLHKETSKYRAHIRVDGKSIHLGLFEDAATAARAYDVAALQHFGTEAVTNASLSLG